MVRNKNVVLEKKKTFTKRASLTESYVLFRERISFQVFVVRDKERKSRFKNNQRFL